jgi:hypothetical protein
MDKNTKIKELRWNPLFPNEEIHLSDIKHYAYCENCKKITEDAKNTHSLDIAKASISKTDISVPMFKFCDCNNPEPNFYYGTKNGIITGWGTKRTLTNYLVKSGFKVLP